MKKIVLFLMTLLFLTACSKNEELYDAGQIAQKEAAQIKANYDKAFVKAFGKPAESHTWGFGGYYTGTRAVIKSDMTNYPSATAPVPVTTKEAEWVTNWFQNNPGLSEQGQPFTNFYVQFVSGDQTNKNGIWHKYDQNYMTNHPGATSNYYDIEFTENGGMDKLHCGATRDQSSTEHLNDFNAKTGGPWDVVYIENGSALQWGYHSSWGEDNKAPNGDGYYWYFKMVELTVPGDCFDDNVARKGWYVGLSLYGKKDDNGEKELGIQRLEYAEDWIVKVVPGETTPTPPSDPDDVCIIAEDLSANDDTDFDFNDVVFTVEYASTTTATVTLYAAGGTLPLTVAGEEVHAKFGYGTPDPKTGRYKMINTGAKADLNGVPTVSFTVACDKSKRGNDIAIQVDKGSKNEQGVYVPNWITLTATKGEPAAKLCVGVDFATGKKWCDERESIKKKYKVFSEWVAKNPAQIWWY